MSGAFPPGSRIGIVGGGQLGRMIALAAAHLGFQCHVLAPEKNPPAAIAARHHQGAYDDEAALAKFADGVDLITYEMEQLPLEAIGFLEGRKPVRPSIESIRTAQDRLLEKRFLQSLEIPVAPFAPFAPFADIKSGAEGVKFPAIMKSRFGGYDGKGQILVESEEDISRAQKSLGDAPALIEERVPFRREISIVAARDEAGAFRAYSPVENIHKDGILRVSLAPARIGKDIAQEAKRLTKRIADSLGHVGVLAVEFFVMDERGGEGSLLVNEIAPRVHNSGHWTMEACAVGQFERHVRAISGWSLGSAERLADAVMVNLLGEDISAWRSLAERDNARLHIYGKNPPREGRKMGHITRLYPLGALASLDDSELFGDLAP